MKSQDREAFGTMLDGLSQVYGNKLGVEGMSIWWSTLLPYSLEQVRAALSDHVKDTVVGKFAPKPADVIAKMQRDDGHPGPEEAWAIVAHVLGNEGASVVWTQPMCDAFFVAADLDVVAARMTFKETYVRAVAKAREEGGPVTWVPSLGHDKSGREHVLLDAVEKGRLSAPHVNNLLPNKPLPLAEGLEIKRLQ